MAFWKTLGSVLGGAGYRQKGKQTDRVLRSSDVAVPVTIDTALQLSSVWACTRLITESVSSLPLNIYRKLPDGSREIDKTHPLHKLFNGKMNSWQTRQEFMETLTYQLVLMGNSYASIERNSRDEIISIYPLMTQQMEVELLNSGGIAFQYQTETSTKIYSQKSIWHNKLFGNGIIGLSPLEYARISLGIGQAAEKATSKVYKNGGKPSGAVLIDRLLTEKQRAEVRNNFIELTEGTEGRLFTLEAGMKFQPISLSPQDIELLASRRFQIEDIARFFGVPSVLINDTAATTAWGSGIQQIVQGFYKLGLRPYLERYEAAMNAQLLTPAERLEYDIEFDFNALLRPDQAERMESNKIAIMSAQMTPNEARALEGKKPKEGGDSLYMQEQMTTLSVLDKKTIEGIKNEKV